MSSGRSGLPLGAGFSSPLGNTTSGAILPPGLRTPKPPLSKLEAMIDKVQKLHSRDSVLDVADDFEPGKADLSDMTKSMKKLASLPGQDQETLDQIERAFANKIRESGVDMTPAESQENLGPDRTAEPQQDAAGGSGVHKQGEYESVSDSLEELPHPDDLDLPEDVRHRLDFEKLTFQLGFVDSSALLNCGPRLLKTQLGEAEVSVYCQYLVRVLSVYYQKVPLEEYDICIFELAHYTHSCATGKGALHMTKREDARIRLVGYGVVELVNKLASVIIPSAALEDPRLGLGLSDEYRTLVLKEIQGRYPDFLAVVKIIYYTALNDVTALESFPISLCYNPDYDDYLSLICMKTGNLDMAQVAVVPKDAPPLSAKMQNTALPKVGAGGVKQGAPSEEGTGSGPQQQRRPQPVPAFPKPSGGPKESFIDARRSKEKVVFDQADLGRATIKRNTSEFREDIDDFTMIYQWLRELDVRVQGVEDTVASMADAIMELDGRMRVQDENMANLKTIVNSRTLASQQRFSESILKPTSASAGLLSGGGAKTTFSKLDREAKVQSDDYDKVKSELIHHLKAYDKVKDKGKLVEDVVGFFNWAGRPELAANVTEKSVDRAMTRSRIVQNLQSL